MPADHAATIVTKDGNRILVCSPTPDNARARLRTADNDYQDGACMTASDVARLIVHLHRILGTMAANPAVVIRKAHIREFPADYPEPEAKTP